MKFATTICSAVLLATAAVAIPAGMTTDRPITGKDCYCLPISGACIDSCGKYTCWSSCGGGGWRAAEAETKAAKE